MKRLSSVTAIIIVILMFTLAACATQVNSTPTQAQTPEPTQDPFASIPPEIQGEVLYVPFPVPITVDGELNDWAKLPSIFVDRGSALSTDPAENSSYTFSVAADADNFYITMQMVDKNIVAGQHAAEFWNEDSMEFFINASGQLNTTKYLPKIFQVNINAADIGNTDPNALTITGVFSGDAKATGFVFKTDDGWGYEASIPLKDLVVPAHGTEIGFQTQINGATVKDRDVKLIWSKADTSDLSWQNPSLFGRAIFFELGRTDVPQPSVVEAAPTPKPTPGPVVIPAMVSANQTGYLPNAQKIAFVAFESQEPLDWKLLDSSGAEVTSGKTTIKGADTTSGDFLQVIDFSSFTTPGEGYQLQVNDLKSAPFSISTEIYAQLKTDAMFYFYGNRSGTPIEAEYAGDLWARPAGHITDSAVTCWKGKDSDGITWPGCDYTLNTAGGWYDAGDFGKYVVNGGITTWTLMNLYEQLADAYPDGSLSIPENSNGVSDLLDEARWEMEFLLSMQVPEGQPQAGMVHHKLHDESWAGMPMVPPTEVNNDNENAIVGTGRYLFPPSTAATLNLAATGAVCARVWQTIDPDFSAKCLTQAKTAWTAALANPEVYAGNNPGAGGGNYPDTIVSDEFYWAAAELFITTGDAEYQDYVLSSDQLGKVSSFDWGNIATVGTLSLASSENNLPEDQQRLVRNNIILYADELLAKQNEDGYSVLINSAYPWGSNGLILNNMMIVAEAYNITGEPQYLDAVRESMSYILGRNPVNISYVSGYGTYAMIHPHHRFWANDEGNGYPPPPAGAVSGGPNANPTDDSKLIEEIVQLPESKRYLDALGSFSTNEVAINWNAPLAWMSAFLDQNR